MKRTRTPALALCLAIWGGQALADTRLPEGWIDIPFPRQSQTSFRARVFAPADANGPVPAVVVAHGSGGIDGRANVYVAALRMAGIAVLEVEMFAPGRRPGRISATYPHVLGALDYLAGHPAIDPSRIGIMGFSWGGALSLAMAQESGYRDHGPNRFAAHVPIYPTCSAYSRPGNNVGPPTGRPVLILAGAKDDYDAPDDCPKVAAAFNARLPGTVAVHVYPDATHIWDSARGNTTFYDPYANRGSGGTVRVVASAETTADSVARTVAFFATALRAGAR